MQVRWWLRGKKAWYQEAKECAAVVSNWFSLRSVHQRLAVVEKEFFRLSRERIILPQLVQRHVGRHFDLALHRFRLVLMQGHNDHTLIHGLEKTSKHESRPVLMLRSGILIVLSGH